MAVDKKGKDKSEDVVKPAEGAVSGEREKTAANDKKGPAKNAEKNQGSKKEQCPQDEEYIIEENDRTAIGVFVIGAIALIFVGFIMGLQDPKEMTLWLGVLGGSAVPLFIIAGFFAIKNRASIGCDSIVKKTRASEPVAYKLDGIRAITVQQGVPGDMSVQTIYFWKTAKEHEPFTTTDEFSPVKFWEIACALGTVAEKKGIIFEDKTGTLQAQEPAQEAEEDAEAKDGQKPAVEPGAKEDEAAKDG